MKVVILAGGKGTRIAEETSAIPKPMITIGDRPIIWHIMMKYAAHGFNEFLIACGYKGQVIKDYFDNYFIRNSDYSVDLSDGTKDLITPCKVDWRVSLIDTGLDTQTGGRILRLKQSLGDNTFMGTYGDGLSDIDITSLLKFHQAHGKLATVTAVRPRARFGELDIDQGESVVEFSEKSQTHAGWINGGFFIFEPGVFDYLENDETILEQGPLERLARDNQLKAYRHTGFWHPMDTLAERRNLESLWATGEAPWKVR